MKFFPYLFGLGLSQVIPFDQTLPVLTAPIVQITAGNNLTYQIVNFRNATCEATLTFHNSTFLPMSAIAAPKHCGGYQTAHVCVPKDVPNGLAALQWQCSGTRATAIDLMVISGGSDNVDGDDITISMACSENTTQTSAIAQPTLSC